MIWLQSITAAASVLAAMLGLGLSFAPRAAATPLLALKEADNCQGCHKRGRGQRPVLERRCTLDCQGCHIDPAGAGARSQWGYWYETQQATPVRFFKVQDPLEDKSRFDVHYDGRVIRRATASDQRTFPMASEFTLRVRPFVEYVHATYTALFMGRIGDTSYRALREDERRFHEKYSLMIDQLPLATYVRAYKGPPMYGVRRPNHTLWIRERLGLDQFATTEAVEVGGTPNVPFLRGSLMLGDPYAEPEDRQKGTSFHGGMRGVTMAWHVNTSLWDTQSEKAQIKMRALGLGLKPWKFIFMAERNWRQVEELEPSVPVLSPSIRVHPSSRIDEMTAAFAGLPGVILGYVQEELHDAATDGLRRSVFADFHPIPFLQFEIWRRSETGTRKLTDTLAILHAYYDF